MIEKDPGKAGIQNVLKEALFYWNRTLLYQIIFSLLYFSVLITVLFFFADHYGILADYLAGVESMKNGGSMVDAQKAMAENPNYMNFTWALIGTLVLLFPLNMGFYKMFRKIDLGEKISVQDLFAGYLGINFFIYTSYYLFWLIIFLYTAPTLILGMIWVALTLFTGPLMFFMDKRIFETFGYNIKAWRHFFPSVSAGLVLALMVKYAGFFTMFLIPFTFAFPHAVIYALYRNIFKENK